MLETIPVPPQKRILVAVLNWGLGHATRCIPIIEKLIASDKEVMIASDGAALSLLKKEFPQLTTLELPEYGIHYRYGSMWWNMLLQTPKILRSIQKERSVLDNYIKKYNIQAVISDNRFGCFSPLAYSIFVTHQIRIKAPYTWIGNRLYSIHKIFIHKFKEVWIPDYEDEKNSLSGCLSHQIEDIAHKRYIGVLSRMKPLNLPKKYDVIVVLSGIEPQRTIFEKQILKQIIPLSQWNFLIIRGCLTEKNSFSAPTHIKIIDYLTSKELNIAIAESEIVLARAGYSTIMDLAVLHKKAILIPTPGQTEQEYLAQYFHQKNIFYSQNQKNLDIIMTIKEVVKTTGL